TEGARAASPGRLTRHASAQILAGAPGSIPGPAVAGTRTLRRGSCPPGPLSTPPHSGGYEPNGIDRRHVGRAPIRSRIAKMDRAGAATAATRAGLVWGANAATGRHGFDLRLRSSRSILDRIDAVELDQLDLAAALLVLAAEHQLEIGRVELGVGILRRHRAARLAVLDAQHRIFARPDEQVLPLLHRELDIEAPEIAVALGDELRIRLLAGLERKQRLERGARLVLGALA